MDPEQRTHNPLVLGSNPSGPTNQPVEDAVVRKIGATACQCLIGRLKLFSQLFETQIPTPGIGRAQNRSEPFGRDWDDQCFESMWCPYVRICTPCKPQINNLNPSLFDAFPYEFA
jgi:hypothetical protein